MPAARARGPFNISLISFLDIVVQVNGTRKATRHTYIVPVNVFEVRVEVYPFRIFLAKLIIQCQIVVACNNTANMNNDMLLSSLFIQSSPTYIFTLWGSAYSHSIVFAISSFLPCLVKSPLCNNTSPGGTLKVREWVSLMQTKRVHSPGDSTGSSAAGLYSR